MQTILKALRFGFSKKRPNHDLPAYKPDSVNNGIKIVTDSELSRLSFTPEVPAEEFLQTQSRQLVRGTFEPVVETARSSDEGDWHTGNHIAEETENLPVPMVSTNAQSADIQSNSQFISSGPLPAIAVKSDDANALRAKIGGDAANLKLKDTISVIELACKLGLPVVSAGSGLLTTIDELSCNEYAVSTLGSRNSEGNLIHALVVSPVLSLEEILSCRMGPAWLANIIRKEQLLVSYRPIRGLQHCEELADRARWMPTEAGSIISKQRGIETSQEND